MSPRAYFAWFGRATGVVESAPEPGAEPRASRGQILVLFALFMTSMLGVLGLAVDLGFTFAERRAVQNAADLAAIAGARAIARYQSSSPTTALDDVSLMVDENGNASKTSVLQSCVYIDQFGQEVGDCSLTVPANATGVSVTVTETHNTYFIRVIPGAPVYVTTTATAEAQIERLDLAGMDSPFIICGYNAKYSDAADPTATGTMDILLSDYVINPDAIGRTFRFTGKDATDIARCGTPSTGASTGARWRGLADKSANSGKRINLADSSNASYWNMKIGSAKANASSITNEVSGIEGCGEGTAAPYDCVMLVPIATEYDPSVKRFKVTKILAFQVFRDSSDEYTYWGTLIDDYLTYGASVSLSIDQAPWCRDCGSVVVARLVE